MPPSSANKLNDVEMTAAEDVVAYLAKYRYLELSPSRMNDEGNLGPQYAIPAYIDRLISEPMERIEPMKSTPESAAREYGVSTKREIMRSGEMPFGLTSDDGSSYIRTLTTAEGGWQISHFHRGVFERLTRDDVVRTRQSQ